MGNWAKSHTVKNAFKDPVGAALKGLKKDITPKMPDTSDTPEETALKQRQLTELAKLDEQENQRIKGLLQGRQGTRLVRGLRASGARSGAAATTVSAATGAPAAAGAVFRRSGGQSNNRVAAY